MEPLKILLLTDGIYPFVLGGMQKYAYYLAKHFTLSGHKVHLVHFSKDSKKANEIRQLEEFENFNWDNFEATHFDYPKGDILPGHYIRENWKYANAAFQKLKGSIDQYDLIFSQGFAAWKFIDQSQKGKLSAPIFTHIHGYEMYQQAPSLRVKLEHLLLLRGPTKFIAQNSTGVISYGGKITELLNNQLSIPIDRIIETPLCLENSWLTDKPISNGNEKRNFVFIGRYERRKGVPELHQAIELLDADGADYMCHFIGPIPHGNRIKSPHVKYHGEMRDESKIKEVIDSCDVLLCPSYSEGMPTVIMEGMARGLAIIATNVGAVAKQIDGNGWLLPETSSENIKGAMLEAIQLDDSTLLEYKKKSLSHIAENFVWEVVIRKLAQQIRDKIQ